MFNIWDIEYHTNEVNQGWHHWLQRYYQNDCLCGMSLVAEVLSH